jgi:hypothetical protein
LGLTGPDKKPLEIAAELKRCGLDGAEYILSSGTPEPEHE